MYLTKKKISGKEYYYLRESVRKGKKVVSKNIAYLGADKKIAEEKMGEIIANKQGAKITYFVHGTTLDNEKEISSGCKDVELSEKGIKQSKELIKQIKGKKFDAIFSSDLIRAVKPAEITFGKGKIIIDKRLRECNYGDFNGKKSEIVEPMQEKAIYKRFPNGESYEDVKKRIAEFLNDIFRKYKGKNIAIVAHKAPQLAIEVLLNNKTWEGAFRDDWRKRKAWQPGWEYFINHEIKDNIMKEKFILLHGYTGTPEECFFPWLKKELEGRGHEVHAPILPNTNNPDIMEQVNYVLKHEKFDSNTILLGHSLGVVIALKVLEKIDKPIKGFISVAGFNKPGFKDKVRPFEKTFDGKFDFEKIKKNAGNILILRDENDSIVPAERADALKSLIGGRIISFKAKEDHVCGKIEPEVLKACLSDNKDMVKEEVKQEKPAAKKLTIDELATFCKRKGFVFKSSEIYGGMAGFWDYGPLGAELFNNIKADFWKFFVHDKENMTGIDASIISHPKTWEASGHVKSFSDVAVVCKKCKKATKIDKSEVGKVKCECGGEFEVIGEFSLMFKTNVGALNPMDAYLRGETAQGMFLDFKNIYDTARVKLPFGIVQVGKCFRNEIAPRDFLFRDREFTIGEFEFFIHPDNDDCLLNDEHLNLKLRLLDAEEQEAGGSKLKETTIGKMIKEKRLGNWHAYWLAEQMLWFKKLGILDGIKIREHMKSELSHYSSATFDLDYEYPFGSKEVGGNANRGQYDLKQHEKFSGEKMEIYDEASKSKIIPRVIEPTFGIDRIFLAVLCKAYHFDEKRQNIILKIPAYLAPVKAAIFPIVKGEEFDKIGREVLSGLKKEFKVVYDDSGSVGRRYARQDESGTPFCITIDSDSVKGKDVTIRERDSTKQIRVKIENLRDVVRKLILGEIEFEKAGKIVETRVKEQ